MEGKWVVNHLTRPLYTGDSSPPYLSDILKNNKYATLYVFNLKKQSAAKTVVTGSGIDE
jgi:hypothetical protein